LGSRLQGRVAILTGGGNGIGEATVRRFIEEGAKVVVNDRDPAALDRVVSSLSPDAAGVAADVADPETPARLVQAALDRFGRLDILVNNAASFVQKGAERATREDWQRVLDVNVVAPAMLIQAAAPHLRAARGSIVNVSSISGIVGQADFSTYAASKAAMVNMTRSLAIDFASDGVRVNTVCPGVVVTSQSFREVEHLGTTFDAWSGDLAPRHMLGRLGRPEEVANAILFLASGEASFITAATLMVDGGYTAW
jgi:NAD(P)-dependent dehydrogenase (short-subunit alcohol dehydrogenase family)